MWRIGNQADDSAASTAASAATANGSDGGVLPEAIMPNQGNGFLTTTVTTTQTTPTAAPTAGGVGLADSSFNFINGAAAGEIAAVAAAGVDGVANNNYVNFNQFILQHNLIGNQQPSNTMQQPFISDYAVPDATHNGYVNYVTGELASKASPATDLKSPAGIAANNQTFEALFPNPNANVFHYNNNNTFGMQGADTSYEPSQSYYNNYYAPTFENIGGVNYFANPFATGLDLCSTTQLQVNAPEFVPSFAKLNLNGEAAVESKSNATATNGNEKAAAYVTKEMRNVPQRSQSATNTTNTTITTATRTTADNETIAVAAAAAGTPTGTGAMSKQNYRQTQNNYNQTNREQGNGAGGGVIGNGANAAAAAAAAFGSAGARRGGAGANNGRRNMDYREEREDRYVDRFDKKPQRQQHYDNHRSNKRRDDWNRNRDRINGFPVAELENSNESPLHSPEKKPSPKKSNYVEHEKLSQREKLIRDIETRRLECLVCVETIKSHQGVWSCHNCYHIMHLKCIITWASSSKSQEGWRCPACQNVAKDVPRDYFCFCGKQKNPPCNRQDLAHACGEVCCRIEGCVHACTLLCHPGPCPPCQANVRRSCGCGKTTKTMQCAMKDAIECAEVCGKLLNCEQHNCTEKCHEGKCPPCAAKVLQKCHCTKQTREVLCTRETHDKHYYSCGKPCGRDLTCGNHRCKDCCHAGECRACKMSPAVVTSCPCGKLPVLPGARTTCMDAIPICEGICGKTLRCGKPVHPHQCTGKCHLGNCPPCNKQTAVKCRCGHMDQMIKCRQLSSRADDARCKKRCTKKRSCGKHKCNQECCIDIDHICPLPCNYTLSCNKHKCDQPCHRGNCPPCYRSSFEELYCECGTEVIMPPVACGTKRPVCKRPCSRAHACAHAPQHNCHSAATCPPCMIFTTKWCFGQHEQRKTIPCSQESFSCGFPCAKPLPCGRHKCIKPCHDGICQAQGEICKQSCTTLRASCGHKCLAPCHEGTCPDIPCKEMVEVQCECGNRKQNRTCHELAREYSRIATAQLASSMAEMQRGNYMELSEILAPVKLNKTNKTLDCNDECRVLERNRRLAIGLQIRNPDAQQRQTTKYSEFVRSFAKRNPTLVQSVYGTLTNLVKLAKESKQRSRSHSFPIMNREKRQLVHELCEMFNVDSVSYDKEPNRNVVATAQKDKAWLPATSIMEVMQRESGQRRVPVPSNNAWGLKK